MEVLTLRQEKFSENEKLIILDNQTHTTKSRKVRAIPLNARAPDILKSREGELFFSRNGLPISPDHLQDKFKKYVKQAGLKRKLTFHSLRHTFASWLEQAGVPIYEVSKLLRNSDIKTTEIYPHLRSDDLRRSVALLDR